MGNLSVETIYADSIHSHTAADEHENDIQDSDPQAAGETLRAFFEAAETFEKATREYIRLYVQACTPPQRQGFGAMSSSGSAGTLGYQQQRNGSSSQFLQVNHPRNGGAAGGGSNGGSSGGLGGGIRSRIDLLAHGHGADDEYDDTDIIEPDGAQELRGRRDVLATKVRVAFLEMRPYYIGKSKYDRWQVLQPDGTLRWIYPKQDGSVEEQILGAHASLPVLKEGLALIEKAEEEAKQAKEKAKADKAVRRQQRQAASAAAAAAGPIVSGAAASPNGHNHRGGSSSSAPRMLNGSSNLRDGTGRSARQRRQAAAIAAVAAVPGGGSNTTAFPVESDNEASSDVPPQLNLQQQAATPGGYSPEQASPLVAAYPSRSNSLSRRIIRTEASPKSGRGIDAHDADKDEEEIEIL